MAVCVDRHADRRPLGDDPAGGRSRSSDVTRASTLPRVNERQSASSHSPAGTGGIRPSVRVHLLGGFDVEVDGRPIPAAAWRLRKASELVKLLALTPGHRLHREQVTEHLWPDRPADAALNNLHQALRAARTALEVADEGVQGVLVLRDGIVSLCPDGELWIDVESFVSVIRDAASASSIDGYRSAHELYRGELLPDDPYAEWAAGPRQALAQDLLSILAQLAVLQERGGNRRRCDRDAPRAARARPGRRACPPQP